MIKNRKFNVNLYLEPPGETEHRHDVLEAARNRLELYQAFGNCTCLEPSETLKNLYFGKLLEPSCSQTVRKNDEISHWILRLAYSRNGRLVKHFIRYEMYWFKLRWSCMDNQDEFWKSIVLPKRKGGLYETPYEECPSIVSKRNCTLTKGIAYFKDEFLFDWLIDKFRQNLEHALKCAPSFIGMKHDERLHGMLEELHPILYTRTHVTTEPEEDLLENLPERSNDFPLCMKILYDTLHKDKHLKYFGRLQLGLFLKGLGLSTDDALTFFREQFLKRITEKKFKKYDYKFRHMYGEVGSMLDYEPYSCEKIQAETQGGKPHGCPFIKGEQYLSRYLESNSNQNAVLEMVRQSQWNKACGEYLKGMKDYEIEVSHPNQYYKCCMDCNAELSDIEDYF